MVRKLEISSWKLENVNRYWKESFKVTLDFGKKKVFLKIIWQKRENDRKTKNRKKNQNRRYSLYGIGNL